MKVRNYLVVFSIMIFAIGIAFISSCVDGKSNKNEGSNKAESNNPESSTENPNMQKVDTKGKAYKNLLDGKDISFEDYDGYVLLIDFWATWCPPCRTEIPWFIELRDKYKDRKFEVIGISLDKTGEGAVKKFIDQFKINYPVIMATEEIVKVYEDAMGQPIRSIPTTFIKNREGKIVNTHIGIPRSANPKGVFEEEILKLLNEG